MLDANYRARPQVSAGGFFIDIVVEGAEDRRLAIELDGDRFHGPDVWERDMTRQAALERAGWVFWRVFGSQWNSNKDYWWGNLVDSLSRLGIEPIGAEKIDASFTEFLVVGEAPNESKEGDLQAEAAADVEGSPEPSAGPGAASDAVGHPDAADSRVETPGTAPSDEAPETARKTDMPTEELTRRPKQTAMHLDLEPDLFSMGQDHSVKVGSRVDLKIGDGPDPLSFTVAERRHDPAGGVIGRDSALGEAILDASPGDIVIFMDNGKESEVQVLRIA